MIKRPINCQVEDGFERKVSGGSEARRLRGTLDRPVKKAKALVADGSIPPARGKEFSKNTFSLGELGIGLNPAARIVGNMLEDEKAFRTCHIALGSNYDNDAEALTHLDGLIKEPTITVHYSSGRERLVLEEGTLI